MPDPSEAIADRVAQALGYGLMGRFDKVADEIKAIGLNGPVAMYAAVCGLAAVAVGEDGAGHPADQFLGLQVQHHGRPASATDVPPAERFAMQFMAAQANRDETMTRALYRAAMRTNPESVADATLIIYEAALTASRERIDKRKAG